MLADGPSKPFDRQKHQKVLEMLTFVDIKGLIRAWSGPSLTLSGCVDRIIPETFE
jgi:hypothetical protein